MAPRTGAGGGSRLKALVYGDTDTGKTVTALSFPSPVVCDPEGGTEKYSEDFKFKIFDNPWDYDAIMEDIDRLARGGHGFCTLVIDPITLVWEQIQQRWYDVFMAKRRGKAGHRGEFYDVQPGDWKHMKRDLKRLVRALHMLDMNVIVTAREKALYDNSSRDMMKVIGNTYDGDKSLRYEFDTVLRLEKDESGQRWVNVEKDRSLKRRFEKDRFKLSMGRFKKALGDDLFREASMADMTTEEQREAFKRLARSSGLKWSQISASLNSKYGHDDFNHLTQAQGETVIGRLKKRAAKKKQTKEE